MNIPDFTTLLRQSNFNKVYGLVGLMRFRFGDHIVLSIQTGSDFFYCTPRESGLPLTDYTHFEVALISTFRNKWGHLKRPAELGLKEFEPYWKPNNVAEYMPREAVQKLFGELVELHGKPELFVE